MMNKKIAILIPCYNEEQTIQRVITSFKSELPDADIYVYDNNSDDDTANIAKKCGAFVKREYRQGKGNVIRSMFKDIDADIYVVVDGDDTYSSIDVKSLINPIIDGQADMVIGDRISNGNYSKENKRPMHGIGNILVRNIINGLYNVNIKDIMTGYRAFNKKFVKLIPILSKGFEIETEITLHALDKNYVIKEVPISYKDRPYGSTSKLKTIKDGAKVLKTIFTIYKDYRPLRFFAYMAFVSFVIGMMVGIPVVYEFSKTHLVLKLPSAILALGFMIICMISIVSGIILDTIAKSNRRNYELMNNLIYDRDDEVL